MSAIYLECPSCGWEGKIDEDLVGKKLKCQKCGAAFEAEVGGTYDLAEPARPGAARPQRPRPAAPSPGEAEETLADADAPDEEKPRSWLEAWPTD